MSFDTSKGFLIDDVTTLISTYFSVHKSEWGDDDLTEDTFKGSKEYELYYTAAQTDAQLQGYFAETFEKLKDYITLKNEKIQRPTTINDRIIEHFVENYGFNTSVRQPTLETRGILAICLDYSPDGSVLNQAIANDIKTFCLVGGIHTEGDVTIGTTLSNGQSFPMSWTTAKDREVEFKYTIIRSRNSNIAELPVIDIRSLILENFQNQSSQGVDIEPQKYLTLSDLDWASSIVGERKMDNEAEFTVNAYQSPYDEKFTAIVDVENIIVLIHKVKAKK